MTDFSHRIMRALASALRIPLEELSPDAAFGETREWDSFAHATLIQNLEVEFGLQLSDDVVVELLDLPSIQREILALMEKP